MSRHHGTGQGVELGNVDTHPRHIPVSSTVIPRKMKAEKDNPRRFECDPQREGKQHSTRRKERTLFNIVRKEPPHYPTLERGGLEEVEILVEFPVSNGIGETLPF